MISFMSMQIQNNYIQFEVFILQIVCNSFGFSSNYIQFEVVMVMWAITFKVMAAKIFFLSNVPFCFVRNPLYNDWKIFVFKTGLYLNMMQNGEKMSQ